jgi:nucleotide-binding universal stress UspA family protein
MPFHPQKILLATDFSDSARPAEVLAADLAQTYGARLTLVHVVPPATYSDFSAGVPGPGFSGFDYRSAVQATLQRAWQEERSRLQARGLEAEVRTLDGHPAHEIARLAGEGGYDLVVLGTHGRTGLKHVLLGSVAEGVVRHSQVPVLTVRAGG